MSIVAVTGATGFLGRALLDALLAAGDTVVALVRPSTDLTRLPEGVATVEYRDLGHSDVARRLGAHAPDAFVHLGWAGVAGPERGRVDHVSVNVPATIESVRLAHSAGCQYWLGTGSQAEYGPSSDVLTEKSPRRPVTEYGVAKVAAAAAAHATGDALGITTGWARVFSLYGPGDHTGAVLPFAIARMLAGERAALGPCTHDWDLLHVDDAAAAFAALVSVAAPGPYNIASGERRPLRDAIEIAADAVDGPVRPSYGSADAPATPLRASIEHIAATTGWRPRVVLEAGVPETVECLRQSLSTTPMGATQ